jgi:DtxR family Mn-dependent transcriptional regulator
MLSLTEENYLKTIFSLNADQDVKASTNAIAEKLETKASSVSDMLKRLNEKKLIVYKKYKSTTLTPKGREIAISIIRKHRLWEFFLVEKLKFGWDEVHDLAEQLEHIQSKELTNRLDDFLDYPEFDPHGDPIPDKNGNFPTELTTTLSECQKGQELTVIGVKDHSSDFLNYLQRLSIGLGTNLKIYQVNVFDKSLEISINQKDKTHISNEVAENLFVKEN